MDVETTLCASWDNIIKHAVCLLFTGKKYCYRDGLDSVLISIFLKKVDTFTLLKKTWTKRKARDKIPHRPTPSQNHSRSPTKKKSKVDSIFDI